MANNNFFYTAVEGDPDMAFINPSTGKVLTDLEYGKGLFKHWLLDPEPLLVKDYFDMILKKGGKLNGYNSKK